MIISVLNIFSDAVSEFREFDYIYKIITFVLAAFVSWLIPFLYRCYKFGRISILNAQLRYIPRKAELEDLNLIHKLVLFPLSKPGIILNLVTLLVCVLILGILVGGSILVRTSLENVILPYTSTIMVCVVISAILVFLISIWMLSLQLAKKDLKGLVGILTTEFKEVLESEKRDDDSIHFATCTKLEDGNIINISYEERMPFQSEEEVKKEWGRVIEPYYEDLKKQIRREISSKYQSSFNVVFKGKEMAFCDFLLHYAYSPQRLWKSVESVTKRMHQEHLINFIGNKIGVWDYRIEKGKLKLSVYHTDHFTFHVFKEIFHDDEFKETFQLFIRRVNLVDAGTRRYMVKCLKFLFSSFGIDITINTLNARGERVMLVGLRNGAIERLGNDKLHVPVNESFSDTDYSRDGLSPVLCVCRGITEELGIPERIVERVPIKFYDFAIVSDEGEIGLSCNADFSSILPIEEMRCYPGQDKYMENKELIEVPYPPFFWDCNQYPRFFYQATHNDALCTQWESFTPLLYQRIIVRKASIGRFQKLFLNFLILGIFTAILMYVYYGSNFNNQLSRYLATAIFSLVINLLIQIANELYDFVRRYKYNYIMPLVPQWNGDVKMLQCNDNLLYEKGGEGMRENHLAGKLTFGASFSDCSDKSQTPNNNFTIDWNHLRLKEPPYCFVRREISGQRESPISFYRVFEDKFDTAYNKLFFCKIPFYFRDGYCTFRLGVAFEKQKRSYHFSSILSAKEIGALSFNNSLTENDIKCFSRYFGIEERNLVGIKKAYLDSSFQGKYVPMDLMEYQSNFYWSLYELHPTFPKPSDDCVHKIDKNTKLYDQYIRDLKGDTSLWFHCKEEDAIKILSAFISHPENRKRIPTVDIYMLQLALIRVDVGCGRLLAVKERPAWMKCLK